MVKAILLPTKPKFPVRVLFFICQKPHSYCSSEKADAIPFWETIFCKLKTVNWTLFQASAFPLKQSETSQKANKKWYPYLRYCHIALGSMMHCFLKMLHIFIRHFSANWTLRLPTDFQASSKSKPKERVSNSLAGWIAFLFSDLVYSSIQRIWYPFRRRPSFKSTPNPSN